MVTKLKTYLVQAGIIVSLFCFSTACAEKEQVIAQVGDSELTRTEAIILMKHQGTNSDNKEEFNRFIQEWVDREVFVQELKKVDIEKWRLVEARSKNFQSELSKYYIEELRIKNKLDTVVSDDEIQDYFESHQDEFILNDYLVQALYLKIPEEVDYKADEIHTKYLLKNDKDLAEINTYAKLYAENYYFDDSSWIYFENLTEDIPLTKYNTDNIVLNRTKTYFSEGEHRYFLNIIDYKLKDETPPLDFLKDQIRGILVSKRLNELREESEPNLIKELKKNHEISIFN